MEKLLNAPPEKIFKSPNTWFSAKNRLKFSEPIPGTGMLAAMRKTTKRPKIKIILFLKSLFLKRNANLFNMNILLYNAACFFNRSLGSSRNLAIFNDYLFINFSFAQNFNFRSLSFYIANNSIFYQIGRANHFPIFKVLA